MQIVTLWNVASIIKHMYVYSWRLICNHQRRKIGTYVSPPTLAANSSRNSSRLFSLSVCFSICLSVCLHICSDPCTMIEKTWTFGAMNASRSILRNLFGVFPCSNTSWMNDWLNRKMKGGILFTVATDDIENGRRGRSWWRGRRAGGWGITGCWRLGCKAYCDMSNLSDSTIASGKLRFIGGWQPGIQVT